MIRRTDEMPRRRLFTRLALALGLLCVVTGAARAAEVVVSFAPGTSSEVIAQLQTGCGITECEACLLPGTYVMTVPAGSTTQEVIDYFSACAEVIAAEANGVLSRPISPIDPAPLYDVSIPDPGIEPIPLDDEMGLPPLLVDPIPLSAPDDGHLRLPDPLVDPVRYDASVAAAAPGEGAAGSVTVAPEPATAALVLLGLSGVLAWHRRRR